jgi:hypothetical protein
LHKASLPSDKRINRQPPTHAMLSLNLPRSELFCEPQLDSIFTTKVRVVLQPQLGVCAWPPFWLPYFSCMLANCCAVVGVVPQRTGAGGCCSDGIGILLFARMISTKTLGLKIWVPLLQYTCADGMTLRRKLMPRARRAGPWAAGVAPVVTWLRRTASSRRPAAPLRAGDSPRASFRGWLPSSPSSSGRFGEFMFALGSKFPRRGELSRGGDTRRCSICGGPAWWWSSTEFVTAGIEGMTGFI